MGTRTWGVLLRLLFELASELRDTNDRGGARICFRARQVCELLTEVLEGFGGTLISEDRTVQVVSASCPFSRSR